MYEKNETQSEHEKKSKFYTLMNFPEDQNKLLANQNKNLKNGHSAKIISYNWQSANDFPEDVKAVFEHCHIELFHDSEFLAGFPEHKVPLLLVENKISQNDIWVLARSRDELISIAVEGKVDEPFDKNVEEWQKNDTAGREERLDFLCEILNLDESKVKNISYQLLHRTASAILEAQRFTAKNALMLVHSYSQTDNWFEDYSNFVRLFDITVTEPGIVGPIVIKPTKENKKIGKNYIKLYFGWVRGEDSSSSVNDLGTENPTSPPSGEGIILEMNSDADFFLEFFDEEFEDALNKAQRETIRRHRAGKIPE